MHGAAMSTRVQRSRTGSVTALYTPENAEHAAHSLHKPTTHALQVACVLLTTRHAVLQVFQTSAQVTDVVGLANAGISSDIAKRMHKQQVRPSEVHISYYECSVDIYCLPHASALAVHGIIWISPTAVL
jgi:hypothetical protein